MAALVVAFAWYLYKKTLDAKKAIVQAYNTTIDATADTIADAIGLTAQEEANAQPINRQSPGFQALLAVSAAYKAGTTVTEETWKTAYSEFPEYGTVLRAGKLWNYGSFWNYIGKDF